MQEGHRSALLRDQSRQQDGSDNKRTHPAIMAWSTWKRWQEDHVLKANLGPIACTILFCLQKEKQLKHKFNKEHFSFESGSCSELKNHYLSFNPSCSHSSTWITTSAFNPSQGLVVDERVHWLTQTRYMDSHQISKQSSRTQVRAGLEHVVCILGRALMSDHQALPGCLSGLWRTSITFSTNESCSSWILQSSFCCLLLKFSSCLL